MQNNCEHAQNVIFPPVAAVAYNRLAGIGWPSDKSFVPTISPPPSRYVAKVRAMLNSKAISSQQVRPLTASGFVSLQNWLRRFAIQASPPDHYDLTAARAFWMEEIRKAATACWPSISVALITGRLIAYGDVYGRGRIPISPDVWSELTSDRPPSTVRLHFSHVPVEPLFRVGDLEWFLHHRPGWEVWSADQALIWLCARSQALVDQASPIRGEDRMTWGSFMRLAAFDASSPVEAMRTLKVDLECGQLVSASGYNTPSPDFVFNAEWHRTPDDGFAYWVLKDRGGELHGLTINAEDVKALYPSSEPDDTLGVPDSDEGDDHDLGTVSGRERLRRSKDALRDDLRQLAQAYVDGGRKQSLRPTHDVVVAAGKVQGLGRKTTREIWAKVQDEFPGEKLSQQGRPPKEDRDGKPATKPAG